MEYDYSLKLILAGDSNVGKTTLFKKIIKSINTDNMSTVGVDFESIYINHENNNYKICLWDTAGQEKYRSIIKKHFENVSGIILIFDLNNPITFDNLEGWIYDIIRYNNCNHDHPIILIGNKKDLENKIDRNKLILLIEKFELIYIETSIINNDVEVILEFLLDIIKKRIIEYNKKCCGVKLRKDEKNKLTIFDNIF